ncbi:hypothetical protein HOA92_06260 [archaeon]|nr:hypothetical protein [archaeon]MBT6762614.1 hypothetical protein [archaeon]
MVHKYKGTFTVIDGLDGIGKGTVQQAIIDNLANQGLRIFDMHQFWDKHHQHPEFEHKFVKGIKNPLYIDLNSFDVLVSSEPTKVGVGKTIREEFIADNGRKYSAHMTARMYAADRMTLYKRVILPALRSRKHVIQSRSVSTSIVYQPMQELLPHEPELTIREVIKIEGNDFALHHSPNLLIIPTIKNVEDVMARLNSREKEDNCEFETINFQAKIKPLYESKIIRRIFGSRKTKVRYLDAGISVKSSKKQAVRIFEDTFPHLFE